MPGMSRALAGLHGLHLDIFILGTCRRRRAQWWTPRPVPDVWMGWFEMALQVLLLGVERQGRYSTLSNMDIHI